MALLRQMPFSGRIDIPDCPRHGTPRIGYMPQRLQFDRGIPMTVLDFLSIGAQRMPLWVRRQKKTIDSAMQLLAAVNADNLASRLLGALSGGELQRILLALALQQDPDLLILDEPAAGVDIHGEHLFCELLEKLRAEHKFTQLMVSHDLATVTHHASHVIMLNQEVIAEGAPEEVLTDANLVSIFGMHMGLANAHSMPDGRTACTCGKAGH
jgi:zinc transport system ATP-binding protein